MCGIQTQVGLNVNFIKQVQKNDLGQKNLKRHLKICILMELHTYIQNSNHFPEMLEVFLF